jgi:hypothetical protein
MLPSFDLGRQMQISAPYSITNFRKFKKKKSILQYEYFILLKISTFLIIKNVKFLERILVRSFQREKFFKLLKYL